MEAAAAAERAAVAELRRKPQEEGGMSFKVCETARPVFEVASSVCAVVSRRLAASKDREARLAQK